MLYNVYFMKIFIFGVWWGSFSDKHFLTLKYLWYLLLILFNTVNIFKLTIPVKTGKFNGYRDIDWSRLEKRDQDSNESGTPVLWS